MATGTTTKMVGARALRKEDPRLIVGEGQYTEDVQLRGTLWLAVLRSPHAHARVLGVDASRALSRPGVRGVLTGADVRSACTGPMPIALADEEGMSLETRWPVAEDMVRYVGEPVAAVVAEIREEARDALEDIGVEYRTLPAVTDMEQALEDISPVVHEHLGTNLCWHVEGSGGDVDGAFREADCILSVRVDQPRLIPGFMEPRAVVASFERGSGTLTVWDTTQEPHEERTILGHILGLPENRIRVIALDLGGGFGAKMTIYPETYMAAIFSMRLGRPVKSVEGRDEDFVATCHGRGERQYTDLAYRNDGTMLGLKVRLYVDMGAYIHRSTHVTMSRLSTMGAGGTYRVKNIGWETYGAYTNKIPMGPYRG